MPADGAAPQTIKAKRKRDPNARVRIGWAVRKEIAATPGLTRLGFELMGRREQLRRIKGQLEREGVPESEMPTARQLKAYWETHSVHCSTPNKVRSQGWVITDVTKRPARRLG